MRALLLAAGMGTRLRPLTDTLPKCLVPVKGRPLLDVWLDRLVAAGVGPFLINTHYLADQVEAFIKQSNREYVRQVSLVREKKLLGTAGTLMANLDFFQEQDGLLIHADNYCLADLQEFLYAHKHRPKGCLMTMMTFRTKEPSLCGIVQLDERGIVVDFHEKVSNPPGNLANGAIYVLSGEFLVKLKSSNFKNVADFSTEVLNHFLGKIYSYETKELFLDIGTPANYAAVNV